MNLKKTFFLSISTFFLVFIFSCTTNTSDEKIEENISIPENNENATVIFENKSPHKIDIYKNINPEKYDSDLLLLTLEPEKSKELKLPESKNKELGDVFYIHYNILLADKSETGIKDIYVEAERFNISNLTFVIKKGEKYKKIISTPLSDELRFFDAYIRIYNQHPKAIRILNGSSLLENLSTEEVNLSPQKKGIYKLPIPALSSSVEYAQLKIHDTNLGQTFNIPNFNAESGYIYDYFFIQEKEKSYIIFDKKQKIKSVPTTKYLKIALEDYSNALEYSEDLKNFMYSDTRLSWSDVKSQYPNSKAIVNGEDYISVNNGFTLDEVYNPIESCGITCRDKDWNITKISDSYLYAKIDTKSFNTMFNDFIKLNNGKLIILSTYLDSKNSGMFLYLLNSNLNLENELCIPGNNSTSYIGYNLCPTDDEGFLLVGEQRNYEIEKGSEEKKIVSTNIFVQKYSSTQQKEWEKQYSYKTENNEFIFNSGIQAIESNSNFILCGDASNKDRLKTIILKIDKTNGELLSIKSFGNGVNDFTPFSMTCDEEKNIYITGLVSENDFSFNSFILKLDSDFNEIWQKKYGTKNNDFLFNLIVKENSIIAVGSENSLLTSDSNYYPWQEKSKGWILKIDKESGIILNNIYSDEVSSFNTITNTDDDGFLISAVKNMNKEKLYSFKTLIVKTNENLEF